MWKRPYLFFEKGLRGGISMLSKRFAKTNNPQFSDYDTSNPNNWIAYLDANDLYGLAMNQFLPVGEFLWVHLRPADGRGVGIGIYKILANHDYAEYEDIVEVDIEYPEHLYDAYSDYLLVPEIMIYLNDGSITKLLNHHSGRSLSLGPIDSHYKHHTSVQDIQYQLLQYPHIPHNHDWPKFCKYQYPLPCRPPA